MELLLSLDRQIFFFVNGIISNQFFDHLMPLLRNKYIWSPLYVFLISYLILNHKTEGFIMVLFAVLTIVCCDQISSSVIKPLVQRLRPCNDPSLKDQVHLLITCGSGFSFISSHAANHFGLAIFVARGLKAVKWLLPAGIVWASLISIAQVYVGVHYPFDVFGGGALGSICGLLLGLLYHRLIRKLNSPHS